MSRDRDKIEEFLPLTGNIAVSEEDNHDQADVIVVALPTIRQDSVNIRSSVAMPADSINRHVRDTVPVAIADTIPSSNISIPSIVKNVNPVISETAPALQDTIGVVAMPDSTRASVWDRIEVREKQIEEVARKEVVSEQKQALAKQSQEVPEKTYFYDAEGYITNGRDSISAGRNLFPVPEGYDSAGSESVFLQRVPVVINEANGSYKEYIKTEINSAESQEAQYSTAWIPVLLIFSLLLLAWIKLIYVQFLTPVLVSAFNYKESVKLYHGKNAPAQNAFIILNVIFAINGGLFLLLISGFFSFNLPEIRPLLLFIASAASLVLLYGFKYLALGFLGFLFNQQRLFSEYKYNISLYNKLYGLALLPLIVGMLYGSESLHAMIVYLGILMAAVVYLLQLVRGLEILVRKGFSVFYLILYLCAFEIFPLLILYKLVQMFLL